MPELTIEEMRRLVVAMREEALARARASTNRDRADNWWIVYARMNDAYSALDWADYRDTK